MDGDRVRLEFSDVLGPMLLSFGLVCAVWAFVTAEVPAHGLAGLALGCCLVGIPATLWGWSRADRREALPRGPVVLGRVGPAAVRARRAA